MARFKPVGGGGTHKVLKIDLSPKQRSPKREKASVRRERKTQWSGPGRTNASFNLRTEKSGKKGKEGVLWKGFPQRRIRRRNRGGGGGGKGQGHYLGVGILIEATSQWGKKSLQEGKRSGNFAFVCS